MSNKRITAFVALFTIALGVASYSTFVLSKEPPPAIPTHAERMLDLFLPLPIKAPAGYELPESNIPDLPDPDCNDGSKSENEIREEKRKKNGYKDWETARV